DTGVYVPVLSNMTQHLFEIKVSGEAHRITSGEAVFENFSFSPDAKVAAFLTTTASTPSRLSISELSAFDPKTLVTQEVAPAQLIGSVERFTWKSSDGTQIASLLLRPPAFQKNLKYPL